MDIIVNYLTSNYDTFLFPLVIFPILIVLGRIADVAMGTLRIVLVSKGYRKLAPIVSFIESFIWIVVAANILSNMDSGNFFSWENLMQCLAYALGYALGTIVGMKIETKLSLGQVLVRAIVPQEADALVFALRENKFGLTAVDASGKDGKVKVLFIVINRIELPSVLKIINTVNPSTFFTVESVQTVNKGYFPELNHQDPISKFSRAFKPGGRK